MGLEIKSVLMLDGVEPKCAEILISHGISVTSKARMSKAELRVEIQDFDALIVRSATKVTKEVLEAGSKLKVVGRAGAGTDNIDIQAAAACGIGVINAPGGNAISACELTCGLILALARHIVPACTTLRSGAWIRSDFVGTELYGKTIAVLGLGRVGREVAVRMHAFGMKVVSYDPFVPVDAYGENHGVRMELKEIWPIADYITLHMPLLKSTENFINASVLKQCKKGVKIINVGRGGLINERDLYAALKSHQVGGAALDVFKQEPPTDEITLKIIKRDNVLASPHLGASTDEAQIRVAAEIAEQLVNLVKPGTYPTPLAEVTKILGKS